MSKLSALDQLNEMIEELEIIVGNRGQKIDSKSLESLSINDKNENNTATTITNNVKNSEKNDKNKNKSRNTNIAKEIPEMVSDEININSIDLRVGIIRKVFRHETAEKLYCEEIDIGDVYDINVYAFIIIYMDICTYTLYLLCIYMHVDIYI